jgi:heme-degrading monooxygenase HmoA
MYAVIFRAELKFIDDDYHQTAKRMRELAISEYGCIEFSSVMDTNQEISVSYWDNEEQIKKWRQNKEHMEAQTRGKEKWYKSYSVQIVEIQRQYENRHDTDVASIK